MGIPTGSHFIYYSKIPTRQYDPNLVVSFLKGRRLVVPASSGSIRDIFTLPFSGSLVKWAVHMSAYADGDYWNISGSDWNLGETIYTKNVPESFVLEIGQNIPSGSPIIFDFYNTGSQAKTVWIDYYFIR
jgi:hypothetical protein